MESAEMKRIVAWKVVAAVCRADATEASFERDMKRIGRQVLVFTVGKRKVAHLATNGRFQLAFGANQFVEGFFERQSRIQTGVATSMSAEFNTGGCQLAQMG